MKVREFLSMIARNKSEKTEYSKFLLFHQRKIYTWIKFDYNFTLFRLGITSLGTCQNNDACLIL